jgi:tripartite ATP-independent transporter DctM subunit
VIKQSLALPVSKRAMGRCVVAANSALMRVVGGVAACLVVAETLILLAGVISRYAFDNPLTWSDEAASSLFIWLSMLGAVLAVARGEHMCLTALVTRLPKPWQSWLRTVSALLVCAFVISIILPAIGHARDEMAITTPALGLPGGLRAAALPVGAILMLLTSVAGTIGNATPREFSLAVVVLGIIGVALWFAQPALAEIGNYNLIIFFVLLLGACVAGGLPIAFAFGMATIAYLGLATDTPYSVVVSRIDEGMSNMILLAVPLFVLLGALLEISGMARNLIDFMASLIGHVRGGLQFVLLAAMFLVSGISGSKVADMAAVAPALFPEMKKRGCKVEDLVALLSATGAMTETIPPSIVLITIGAVCSVSITALFTGGLLPAVVATAAITLVCWARSRRDPKPDVRKASSSVVRRTLVAALPALALPVLIRYAVVMGVATATEVATVGIAYTVVVGLMMHRAGGTIDFRRLYPMLVNTATLSGAILLTIGMATAMSWALTQSGFSADVVELMTQVAGGWRGFMLITIVAFMALGSVLEGIPAIVLFGPLLFPVAKSLGINEVHYSMVVIVAMGMGMFAPPFGVGFYAACSIGKVSADAVFARVWGYLAALLLALLVIAFVPWISTGFLK